MEVGSGEVVVVVDSVVVGSPNVNTVAESIPESCS